VTQLVSSAQPLSRGAKANIVGKHHAVPQTIIVFRLILSAFCRVALVFIRETRGVAIF
jgi:hypothetical protein